LPQRIKNFVAFGISHCSWNTVAYKGLNSVFLTLYVNDEPG